MGTLDRLEIRPPKFKHAAKLLALEAFLLPASCFAAFEAERLSVRLAGILGILFFGVGGVAALYVILKRTWSFAITNEGIEINGNTLGYQVSKVPWQDIEDVGIATVRKQKMVGIRLSSYDSYLASRGVSLGKDYGVGVILGAMKVADVANVAALIPDAGPVDYLKDIPDHLEVKKSLKPWRGAKGIVGLLQGNRMSTGYDLAFGWNDLDRSPQASVDLVREQWRARQG